LNHAWHRFRAGLSAFYILHSALPAFTATFNGSASVKVTDPTSSLSAPGGNFTVSCWFRLTVPTSLVLSQHMTLIMDRLDGNENLPFSYLIRLNYSTGDLEFVTRGTSSTTNYVKTLLRGLFVDRWYHACPTRPTPSTSIIAKRPAKRRSDTNVTKTP
jgi:hypothetical protein